MEQKSYAKIRLLPILERTHLQQVRPLYFCFWFLLGFFKFGALDLCTVKGPTLSEVLPCLVVVPLFFIVFFQCVYHSFVLKVLDFLNFS